MAVMDFLRQKTWPNNTPKPKLVEVMEDAIVKLHDDGADRPLKGKTSTVYEWIIENDVEGHDFAVRSPYNTAAKMKDLVCSVCSPSVPVLPDTFPEVHQVHPSVRGDYSGVWRRTHR